MPNDAQDFSFTTGGGLSPASFDLDDDSDGTLSNTRTFADLVPGSGYSVSQTTPAGWDLDSATCDDGSPLSDISIAAGETVTCTFVHHRHGSVTASSRRSPTTRRTSPSPPAAASRPRASSSTTTPTATLSNTRTFTDVSPQSGYSLAETVPGGWDQSSATCDDGSPVSNIDVAPGEHVTCTFTNRKRGAIVVVQDSAARTTRRTSRSPPAAACRPASFSLDDDSDGTLSNTRTFANVPATNGYSIAQSLPRRLAARRRNVRRRQPGVEHRRGPRARPSPARSTNNKRGQIVVVKDATPNDPQDFSFTAGGGLSPASFSLDDDSDGTLSNTRTFDDVAPGSGYSVVRERARAAGSRRARPVTTAARSSNIDVARGRDRHLHVLQPQVRQDRGGQGRDARTTRRTSRSPPAAACRRRASRSTTTPTGRCRTRRTFNDVTPGSGYSVAETVPAGWSQASATCSDGSPTSNIDVSAGETVTCTFVNTRGYPRPKGATPLRASMVVAYASCASPNRIARPAARVPLLQPAGAVVDIPDRGHAGRQLAHGQPWSAACGSSVHGRQPGTPADEADVMIETSGHRRAPEGGPRRLHGRARGAGVAPDHRPPERARAERGRDRDRRALRVRGALHRHVGHRQRGSHLLR